MINFVVLDDDTRFITSTVNRLVRIFEKNDIDASVVLSTTKSEDVIAYCSNNKTKNNVYLLDVDIHSETNGIEIAGRIRQQDFKAYIVFISAHPEYVLPSLKTRIFDYLVKPVSYETLEKCITSIYKDFGISKTDSTRILVIKSGFNVYNLVFEEIIFLEKFGHHLVIHTTSGRIESTESLESIETRLNEKCFFRCHKSYIVNITFISKADYSANTIYLKNGETCLVSKRCKKELRELCLMD